MKALVASHDTDLLTLLLQAGYSKTKARQLLKYEAVTVNDQQAGRPEYLVKAGDRIAIRSEQEARQQSSYCPELTIIHEDEALIVIEKPAGLLTIATDTEKRKTAFYLLSQWLKERAQTRQARIFIVHRLDQGTSGLLVFAKTEAVKQALQEQWGMAKKQYIAIVEGVPAPQSGQIVSRLSESKALRVYSVHDDPGAGKEAVTNYQVVRQSPAGDYAMLEITLITGRKNQIRVHMADQGHPIVGDKKYGAKTNPLRRLALHSHHLAFPHPTIPDRYLSFTSEIPGKFYQLFSAKKPLEPLGQR